MGDRGIVISSRYPVSFIIKLISVKGIKYAGLYITKKFLTIIVQVSFILKIQQRGN